jgi:hypothetical protein
MQPRRWSPPAVAPAPVRAADPSNQSSPSPQSHWGAVEYAVSFVYYMLFFGSIGFLFRSRFPIELGLFFFVNNDDLREWALRKVGIRLVPGTLAPPFVQAFVWLTGASILFGRWKASAPAWMASWFPPPDTPWPVLAGMALACAALWVVATAVVGKVLPWFGIELARDSLGWTVVQGLIGFAILGLLLLLASIGGY